MKSKLNNTDYKKILNYYNFSIPKSKKLLKKKANKTYFFTILPKKKAKKTYFSY